MMTTHLLTSGSKSSQLFNSIAKSCARAIAIVAILLPLFSHAAGEIGKIGNIIGSAKIVRGGKSIDVTKDMAILETDELITSDKTALKILFTDGSSCMAFANSQMSIKEYKVKTSGKQTNLTSTMDLMKGKVRFYVKPSENGGKNDVTYKTPNAVMGIRGTSGFIDLSQANRTQVVVLTGKVEVKNPAIPNAVVTVPPNQFTSIIGNTRPTPPRDVPMALLSNLNSEASRVDPSAGNETKSDTAKPTQDSKESTTDKKDGTDKKEPSQDNSTGSKKDDLPKKDEAPKNESDAKAAPTKNDTTLAPTGSENSSEGSKKVFTPSGDKAVIMTDKPGANTPTIPNNEGPRGRTENAGGQRNNPVAPNVQTPSAVQQLNEVNRVTRDANRQTQTTIQNTTAGDAKKDVKIIIRKPNNPQPSGTATP